MSQNDLVLDYLTRNGRITQAEAVERFGCYRLGARIYDLKGRGVKIRRRIETGLNRFGCMTHYAVYSMGEKDGTGTDSTL